MSTPYTGPFRVVSRREHSFVIALPSGGTEKVTLDRLKPAFIASDNEEQNEPESPPVRHRRNARARQLEATPPQTQRNIDHEDIEFDTPRLDDRLNRLRQIGGSSTETQDLGHASSSPSQSKAADSTIDQPPNRNLFNEQPQVVTPEPSDTTPEEQPQPVLQPPVPSTPANEEPSLQAKAPTAVPRFFTNPSERTFSRTSARPKPVLAASLERILRSHIPELAS